MTAVWIGKRSGYRSALRGIEYDLIGGIKLRRLFTNAHDAMYRNA